MNENIKSLLSLQEIDDRLSGFRKNRDGMPSRKDDVRRRIEDLSRLFEEARQGLTDAKVARKNLELDIEAKDQAVRKNSSELNSVKTNEAYKSLLKQMDDAKKAKSDLEDQLLELMEKADDLQAEVKNREKALQEQKGVLEKELAGLEEEEKALSEQVRKTEGEKTAYMEKLPPPVRDSYERVQRGRPDMRVLAAVDGGYCGGCRMNLPASVVNEVMKAGSLTFCETCSRILFIPEKEGASS